MDRATMVGQHHSMIENTPNQAVEARPPQVAPPLYPTEFITVVGIWEPHGAQAPREIFRGITYGCHWLEATEEGSGLLH